MEKIRFLDIVKPRFGTDAARAALASAYGVHGELHALDGERDLNFRVAADDGRQYLFKISNRAEPAANVDFEIAALRHIAAVHPDIPVPRVQPARDGSWLASAMAEDGTAHPLRLLSFLPGTPLAQARRTDALVYDQGRIAARMALALQGFFHPAAGGRQLLWDVRELKSLAPVADSIGDERVRKLVRSLIGRFEESVRPRLAALRAQIAHMDLTRYNMVVDPQAPERVAGVIDFGDMHHGPLAQDVAVALADVMQPETDPYRKAQVFLRGYQSVLPLQDGEVELLYELVLAYLVAYYLIVARRREAHYANDEHMVLAALEDLLREGRESVTDRFVQAGGRPRPAGVGAADSAALRARRRAVLGAGLELFYEPPLHVVRAEGVWLTEASGRRVLDAYNNVPVVGHAHPWVVQAAARQAARLATNTRYLGDEIVALGERLVATMPAGLAQAAFVNSGSEATELAWRLATAATANRGAIVVENAYHGWTLAAAALSPSALPAGALPAHVRVVPAPDRYRAGPLAAGELLARCARAVDEALASLARAGLRPALCIVDAAFCSSGIHEPLPGYLSMLFEKVRAAGGLCVADEVQSGYGRMGGELWGFARHGVVPDLVTLGKPMANGYPMGAVVTRADVLAAGARDGAVFATFGGNNVAAAAAAAVLDVIEREGLVRRCAATGDALARALRELAARHEWIGDVRASGLILGVELVMSRASRTPAREQTTRLLSAMAARGVAVGSDGPFGNVVKIRPPLAFGEEHVALLVASLDACLGEL